MTNQSDFFMTIELSFKNELIAHRNNEIEHFFDQEVSFDQETIAESITLEGKF